MGTSRAEHAEPPFLVVDDEAGWANTLAREIRDVFPVEVCDTLMAATRAVTSKRFAGAVVDILLRGENGLDLAASWRARRGADTILMISADARQATANCCSANGLLFAYKDDFQPSLNTILASALADLYLPEAMQRPFKEFVLAERLEPIDAKIFALHLKGCSRKGMTGPCRMSLDGIKTRIRRLLDRLKATSLKDLEERMWAMAGRARPSGVGI